MQTQASHVGRASKDATDRDPAPARLMPTRRPGVAANTNAWRDILAAETPAARIFAEMHYVHAPSMLKWARGRCRDESEAWDLVQDTFERALRARPAVTDHNDLRRWLFTVLRNRHYDHCRSVEVRLMADVDLERMPMIQADGIPIWKRVELSQVRALLPSLSSGLCETFNLHVAGVPTAEIARRLLIRPSTVATRIFRARRKLQELILATLDGAECEHPSGNIREIADTARTGATAGGHGTAPADTSGPGLPPPLPARELAAVGC